MTMIAFLSQCLQEFTLLAFTAAIPSSAWWQSYSLNKDKKLDLSGELNVPSISTILLIFHQSCASSSEPWSHYSLREMASIWQAWKLQEKVSNVRKLWWEPGSVGWQENPQTGMLKLKANKLEAAIHLLSTWRSWKNLKTSRRFRRLFSWASTKRGNHQTASRAKWNANCEEALDICRSSCSWADHLGIQPKNWMFYHCWE